MNENFYESILENKISEEDAKGEDKQCFNNEE